MNKKELDKLAQKIFDYDKKYDGTTTSMMEITSKIEPLIKNCSLTDLLELDEIIQNKCKNI